MRKTDLRELEDLDDPVQAELIRLRQLVAHLRQRVHNLRNRELNPALFCGRCGLGGPAYTQRMLMHEAECRRKKEERDGL